MLLDVLMQYSCIIFNQLSPLMRRFRNSQIVTITNFVVESSGGGTRVDCIKDCITVRALDKKKIKTKLYETKINGHVGFKL